MVRVKRGNIAVKRRRKYLKMGKGFVGVHSKLAVRAGEQVIQGLNSAYIGRKLKKRTFRKLWIYRINAASRARSNIYSKLIGCLRNINIFLDRKILSLLASIDLSSFNVVERQSRKSPLF
uniref:50S ribosomal protein L20 n=1 Tax=Neotessella volvocina TaxID=52559 RepID=A0A3G2QZU9_9STRA|nr:ribosomal protein L20 [Neotessella volvocina]